VGSGLSAPHIDMLPLPLSHLALCISSLSRRSLLCRAYLPAFTACDCRDTIYSLLWRLAAAPPTSLATIDSFSCAPSSRLAIAHGAANAYLPV